MVYVKLEKRRLNFSDAFACMKKGLFFTREEWDNKRIKIGVQYPDKDSKMTKPYLILCKNDDVFPINISCEILFAEDLIVI